MTNSLCGLSGVSTVLFGCVMQVQGSVGGHTTCCTCRTDWTFGLLPDLKAGAGKETGSRVAAAL